MTALAMNCIKSEQHPNADALRLYEFSCVSKTTETAGEVVTAQIVANLENVYEVGDTAIIVLPGSTLKDGTKIKPKKIRDVASYGMAVGKTDAAPGTDLTDEYCLKELERDGASHIPWPDIESLFNIRRWLKQQGKHEQTITYKAKVKLDGTNAGIQIKPDGKVFAQSRSRLLDEENDNLNFAKWAQERQDYWARVRDTANALGLQDKTITIFGEYCGQGIQKRTAISSIDRKIFAVFAIQYGELDAALECSPDVLSQLCREGDDVFVLPWYGDPVDLDYTNSDVLQLGADKINKMVEDVEQKDPWVKEKFGIEGIGEGVVLYPIIDGQERLPRDVYTELVFKAKGEKHQVVKTKKPVQVDPEVAKSVGEFVELMVTENRLEQMAEKVGGFDLKKTGEFLKALGQDVQKESVAELEAAKLEWKQVAKEVATKARKWWAQKCKTL